MEFFSKLRKSRYALPFAVALIVVIAFAAYKIVNYKSPEYIKNEEEIKKTIATGWPIKHLATVESNQDKLDEFRKALPEYYSNDERELTKQQQFITVALNTTVERGVLPEVYEKYYLDENQAVTAFKATTIEFDKIRIKKDRAEVEADLEYYVKRRALSQEYSTYGKDTYRWDLVKKKDKWLIEKETLIPKDKG